ncbi:hypothetical protein M378DRAFT_164634 [Amanita muscaria Koide BX008]|uniref:Uncharacterized protein n=1 Tax=Amanita muscaria (strain Koide BX008) TaxID=946122 RepID=A0A0C2SJC8_AMAMK|nr:hypothetical protein M378DRAFT_164634 [Amanita muscaria Koide BX008]
MSTTEVPCSERPVYDHNRTEATLYYSDIISSLVRIRTQRFWVLSTPRQNHAVLDFNA